LVARGAVDCVGCFFDNETNGGFFLRWQTRLVVEALGGVDFGSNPGGRSDGQDGVSGGAE
jgi:hypothetical protein